MYLNNFSSRSDVIEQFGIDPSELNGCSILLASYGTDNYCGDAYILFERDGELYEVHGSHCSCYGLSETNWDGERKATQWFPEQTTLEAIKHRFTNGSLGSDDYSGNVFKDELENIINLLETGIEPKDISPIIDL